jgi:hypothetical protein
MPEQKTIERARKDAREGKAPSQHASGRIRTRGNGPYPGGQAWRAFSGAGHRHRPIESAARRRQAEAARQRKGLARDTLQSPARLRQGTNRTRVQAGGQTLPLSGSSSKTGRPFRGVAQLAVASFQASRESAPEAWIIILIFLPGTFPVMNHSVFQRSQYAQRRAQSLTHPSPEGPV